MSIDIISHDIQSLVPTDKIGQSYIVKQKILWGIDGAANDISSNTPLPVSTAGSFIPPVLADSIVASYPDSITEIYQYKQGGVSGTVLMTITVTYTDSTKANINTVVKS
jgi:hypothetical protein